MKNKIQAIILTAAILIPTLSSAGCNKAGTTVPTGGEGSTVSAEETSRSESRTSSTTNQPYVTATASVSVTGDLLMHDPILTNNYNKANDTYDFSDIFTYLKPYVQKSDFAVANLEVTLAGDKIPYRGYPCFNCPDAIVDATQDAGFDMLLTANNHSNDSWLSGILRTADVLKQKGMDFTGTRSTSGDKPYLIKNINGIKVGFMNYTYESRRKDGVRYLNVALDVNAAPLVNSFHYQDLDGFYNQAAASINQMKDEGAEAIVMFIHWGVEYKLKPNNTQKKIAQKLCDLDVDVIIGGHPHVIQPLEILKSKDGNQIVCLYSTGNAVSNQRIYRASIKTGHTEDGILFTATFSKYSDGMVKVTGLDALPTWVHLYDKNGRDVFQIVPLDKKLDWKQDLGLQNSEDGVDNAKKSYDRTIALVKDGLDEFKRIA